MRIREATAEEAAALRAGRDADRFLAAYRLEDGPGTVALAREPFDSEIFGMAIGRVVHADAPSSAACRTLYGALAARASGLGLRQVLRRVPVSDLQEVWALEGTGFELMDVGVTFARNLTGPVETPAPDDLLVRIGTDADMTAIVPRMIERPWGSRFESDPSYTPEQVRELRSRWLWNSHRGRAQAVLVGILDGRPAGYVTCLLDAGSRIGEIELVGTLPEARGRRVASRILEHAVAWFSSRADRITVRTQATNFVAASLYEKAGFTLCASDMTFRLAVRGHEVRVP